MRAAVVAMVASIAVAVVGCGRDEASYQYGFESISFTAHQLWLANLGDPPGSPQHSVEEACKVDVHAALAVDDREAELMRTMDKDDIIDGCIDALTDRG